MLGPDDLVEAISLILGPPAKPETPPDSSDELLDAIGPAGRSVDWLATHLGMPVPEVLARLARLETQGLVSRSGGQVIRSGVPLERAGSSTDPDKR